MLDKKCQSETVSISLYQHTDRDKKGRDVSYDAILSQEIHGFKEEIAIEFLAYKIAIIMFRPQGRSNLMYFVRGWTRPLA